MRWMQFFRAIRDLFVELLLLVIVLAIVAAACLASFWRHPKERR